MQKPTVFGWKNYLTREMNALDIHTQMARESRWLPSGAAFDEAAIMVPSIAHVERLAAELERGSDGWECFNQSEDEVRVSPFGTGYLVDYWFFKNPRWPWRLEVMCLRPGGFSPLHAALWPCGKTPEGEEVLAYPIPHFSFKADVAYPGRELQRSYSLAVDGLRNSGLVHAQTCQSTYGAFGYYLPASNLNQLYIKPRINMRDHG